jgi:tetratricopeptide (TPR) repeat protein
LHAFNLRAYLLMGRVYEVLKKGSAGGRIKAREAWSAGLAAAAAAAAGGGDAHPPSSESGESGGGDLMAAVELAVLLEASADPSPVPPSASASVCDLSENLGVHLGVSLAESCPAHYFTQRPAAAAATTAAAASITGYATGMDSAVGEVYMPASHQHKPASTTTPTPTPMLTPVPTAVASRVRQAPSRQATPLSFGTTNAKAPRELEVLYGRVVGDGADQVSPALLLAVRQQLSHATGNDLLDGLIAVGYLQVNTGQLDEGIALFKLLVAHEPQLVAAHLGLGSCFAMRGQLEAASDSFSAAVCADGSVADAWKRRGQTRAARGMVALALGDFNRALELDVAAGTAMLHVYAVFSE